jgi:two-component system cell cycle response regulator
MALRVLLADESATIKKIFQLALQDFGIELTAVSLGTDVLPVALRVEPDIIFADVILQKMSGYDVCKQVRSHPQFAKIPVVLIWSGFMELDPSRFKECKANEHLEKPFDTEQLRALIKKWVPKTQQNALANFLTFPKMPEFQESDLKAPIVNEEMTLSGPARQMNNKPPVPPPIYSAKAIPNIPSANPLSKMPPPPDDVDNLEFSVVRPMPTMESTAPTQKKNPWSMESFEDIPFEMPEENADSEDFVKVDLKTQAPPPPPLPKNKLTKNVRVEKEEDEDNLWIQRSLADYKLKKEELEDEVPSVSYATKEEKADIETFVSKVVASAVLGQKQVPKVKIAELRTEEPSELELELGENTAPKISEAQAAINERQVEAIIRAQAKEIIEKVVWQVVPEIASQIIERELQKLIKERDQKF